MPDRRVRQNQFIADEMKKQLINSTIQNLQNVKTGPVRTQCTAKRNGPVYKVLFQTELCSMIRNIRSDWH